MREFTPIHPGAVSIYLCGATVQAPPHIGHIRSGVNFDIFVRWLKASGYQVTFCRNVTDIDDKILRVAAAEELPWWAVAQRNERAFTRAYEVLGCLPPDVEPRATGHVPEMIALMRRLIDGGHAYAAGGDVYFDVSSWPAYGALSGQRLDHMRPADDTDTDDAKRDPRDFTLWKGAKPGEPFWETPWGPGRPGWHLECSAMATKYLGPAFDIHGGGLDLVFPHHENELAQSRAAGDEFAHYWMHNGLLGVAGEKMSKSLGNSLLVDVMVTKVRPVELRYYLGQAHYRSAMEYSPEALAEAVAAYRGIEGFVLRANELTGAPAAAGPDSPAAEELATVEDLAAAEDRPAPGTWQRSRPRPGPAHRRRPGAGRRSSPPRSTTTSACPRRSRWSTPPCTRATTRWPRATPGRPPPRWRRSGPCWACSGSTRWPSRGPAAAPTTTCARWSTPWSRPRSPSGRRRATARTTRRPTRSGTICRPPA